MQIKIKHNRILLTVLQAHNEDRLDMKKILLVDRRRSILLDSEAEKYKKEITTQKNNPICKSLTTTEVAKVGVSHMKKDNFTLVKEQIDV